jgi:SWIM zinc finger
MATVADAARSVGAPPPLVRHGISRLTIHINGTDYRLHPCPPEAGILAAWSLRKIGTDRPARYIVTAPKGVPARCTCPDHERSGWTCKHLGALTAAGLIPDPKPAKARKTSPARARQLHVKNARQAIGQAQAIVESRPVSLPADHLPEGWQPGGAYSGSAFATGFNQAVRAHVARIGRGGYEICDGCGAEFDIQISGDPNFCEACVAEGGDA